MARYCRGACGDRRGAVLEIMLERQGTYSDGAIVALILLGVSISLFISLFVNVLSESWLEGLPGSKIAGQVYQLSRFHEPAEAYQGRNKKATCSSGFLTRRSAKPRLP